MRLIALLSARVLLGFAAFAPLIAVAATATIDCGLNVQPDTCPFDAGGNVALVHDASQNKCVKDRTWGHDLHGIWVHSGCKGTWAVGLRETTARAVKGSEQGLADGISALLAAPRLENGERPTPTKPARWAIGTFSARDPNAGQQVWLEIDPKGAVELKAKARNGPEIGNGIFSDGTILWKGGRRTTVAQDGDGLRLDLLQSNHHFTFRR